MPIRNIIQKILTGKDETRFGIIADSEGLNFTLPQNHLAQCRANRAGKWAMLQYVTLKMLEEQGYAEQIVDGYLIPSEPAVAVDEEAKKILEFPPPFPGSYCVNITGETFRNTFAVQIIPVREDGSELPDYELKGPCLRISSQEIYLLSQAEWLAFAALRTHQQRAADEKNEWRNLQLVGSLQAAKKLGMKIDLAHFDELHVQEPESVGVNAVLQADGSLHLTPTFATGLDPEEIRKRLGQLQSPGKTMQDFAVIRVQQQIVVLDEKRLEAAHEILTNRTIPKEQVKKFLETPSAFLDASLVDLDTGFSLRVHGATVFRPAYFGATDESGIDWFEQAAQGRIYPPNELEKLVTCEELPQLRKQLEETFKAGATLLLWANKTIDVVDTVAVECVIKRIEKKCAGEAKPSQGAGEKQPGPGKDGEGNESVVVDITLNDFEADEIPAFIRNAAYKGAIDYAPLKRRPFPHQDEGIRWILGLAERSFPAQAEQESHGALLADDMGLGKTYMSLVAVAEYYRLCREKQVVERPVLVVVPLTLLENWQEEIAQTFHESPFADAVLLQADADLSKFRIQGGGVETRQDAGKRHTSIIEMPFPMELSPTTLEDAIRYSLKTGKNFGQERLDLPKRLVLTTYQTLRDYQFSLCRVDWSFVIFDEAQHIKNPNTLATRAAKGLKAQFKLLATGTPVENSLRDFWCLMDTAKPNLLGAYQNFRQEYIAPITQAGPDEVAGVRQAMGLKLRRKVGALMLRRLKEEQLQGLPQKHIFAGTEEVEELGGQYDPNLAREMLGEQRQRYDTAIDTVVELQQQGSRNNPVLAGLHQLRDISLHPRLSNNGLLPTPKNSNEARDNMALSGKLAVLLDLLNQIKERNEKALLFLINKRLQSFLKIALGRIYGINVEIINGDTPALARAAQNAERTRKGIIDAFSAEPGFGVIIMSPIAAGTGLTVVAANNVIHLERHWNPAKENQATDRVYRIGQTRDVNIYLPVLTHPDKPSFDVNLHRLLAKKVTLKDAVVTPEEVTPEEMGRANFPGAGNQEDSTRPLRGSDLERLSPREFEALCAEIYGASLQGTALLTANHDFGADVVVFDKNGNALIQCKHQQNAARPCDRRTALREIYSAKPMYEERTGKTFATLIVATNACCFSRRVIQEAQLYGVRLATQKDMDELLQQYPVCRRRIQQRLLAERF